MKDKSNIHVFLFFFSDARLPFTLSCFWRLWKLITQLSLCQWLIISANDHNSSSMGNRKSNTTKTNQKSEVFGNISAKYYSPILNWNADAKNPYLLRIHLELSNISECYWEKCSRILFTVFYSINNSESNSTFNKSSYATEV